MDPLVEQAREAFRQHRLAGRNARILVAVSAGLDSMVLLHLLRQLAPEFRWQLAIAHFDHRLRGRASEGDRRFVEKAAKSLSLRCFAASGDVRTAARKSGESLEMAARTLRHQFLARAAKSFRAGRIALGHHADDQVELFFLRLIRGASTEGLGGMNWLNASPADSRCRLIRPLLGIPRSELAAFCTRHRLKYREDLSNADVTILRNRVRLELLPMLQRRFGQAVPTVVARTMETLRGDGQFVLGEALRYLAKRGRRRFSALPPSVQRKVVQIQLRTLDIEPDFQLIEALRLHPGKPVTTSAGRSVLRQRDGTLAVERHPDRRHSRARREVNLSALPHSFHQDGINVRWEFRLRPHRFPNPHGREQFDAEAVGASIVLRRWRPGDRFRPLGFPRPTKLQDLFVNRKVGADERRERLVATTTAGEIFWVEGLPPGERFKLTSKARRVLVWTAERRAK